MYFFVVAISSYLLGSYLMPVSLDNISSLLSLFENLKQGNEQALRLLIATLLFFVVVPIAYWYWVIKAYSTAKWRLLIAFSLSCLIARYQYPPEIAQYFDFVAWLRYPIITMLLALEFYIMFQVGKSLWQARKLSGDPRINILTKYHEGTKERELGLMLAYEPASWYYAIPRFSRNHVPAVGRLKLLSSTYVYLVSLLILNLILVLISYFMLVDWSKLAAIIVSTLFLWGTTMIIANYRCSKHYSVYVRDNKLR